MFETFSFWKLEVGKGRWMLSVGVGGFVSWYGRLHGFMLCSWVSEFMKLLQGVQYYEFVF